MKLRALTAVLASASFLAAAVGTARNAPAAAETPAASQGVVAQESAPLPSAVGERSDRLLQEMGRYLGTAEQLTFHAEITFEHVLPSGQKLQFAAAQDVALLRPDRLFVDYRDDLGAKRLWFDGTSITLLDAETNTYATEPVPGTLDQALDETVEKLGFSPPLADLLYADPYGVLRDKAQFGFYVGLGDVDGTPAHHLAFVEKDVDWQIWIEDGVQWVPRKLVITYKALPSQPQFTAVLSDWDFAPRLAEPLFSPELPPDARQIAFAKLASQSQQ